MGRKGWQYWLLLAVMAFVVMAGGCGGGGSDAPAPGTDQTPPGTDQTPIEFSALSGTWVARQQDGTATASGPDGTFQLTINQGTIGMLFGSTSGTQAQADVAIPHFSWNVYQNGGFVETLVLYNGSMAHVTVTRTAYNKFRYVFQSGNTIDMTVQSPTVVFVEEQGTFVDLDTDAYDYQGSYYMDKR